MTDRYDLVVIGGGSAGSVIAARLSEDAGTKVLVLEAGRPDYKWDVFIHMPGAFSIPIGKARYDWMYESEPEPHMGGRRIYHARGKVLGGSSSINGMIFQRGNPMDFERWASDPGMSAWDYAHCLPYFKRMENCLEGADDFRGDQGPLILERGPATNPLFEAFLEAVQQAGYPLTDDVNGFQQEGFARFDRNIHRGRRLSAARAYLHPAMGRANLDVVTRALVTKIRFAGNRAVGVEYVRRGRAVSVDAAEVVLCGGSINSPQLLQVSGVGPASHLEAVGVEVVMDHPGVGENLQDHLEVYVQHASSKPVSMYPAMQWRNRPLIGLQWLRRTGAAATNHFEAGGFIRSNDTVTYPNLMFHFLPLAVRYDGTVPGEGGHGYQVHVGPMYSDSKGSVMIQSPDVEIKPALRFNYLSTQRDQTEWIEAIHHSRHILGQAAFAEFDDGELSPGPGVRSDAEILDWVRGDAETALHPCGTAKMGIDEMAVVDPATLAVRGLEGLRVVDASVMPYVTNGNIYAPVMMLAEKAADAIAGNEPLPADPVQFYRHDGGMS